MMAGDWIKFELTTLDKPEVCQISELADIDLDAVVGKLMRIWGWFDQQTEEGNAPSVSNALPREEKSKEPLSMREPVDPRMPSDMTLEWHPDHKLLKTYALHSGVALDLFTDEVRRAFTAHYEPRGQVNTQAEWVQMFVKWVLNDRNRAASSNVKQFPARTSAEPDFDSTAWAANLMVPK